MLGDDVYKRQESSGLIFIGYRNKNGFKRGVRPGTLHLNRSHRQPNKGYNTGILEGKIVIGLLKLPIGRLEIKL